MTTAKTTPCRFRIIVPAYPAFNIYSRIACYTTALGPLCVATVVNHMPGWVAEVVDENNLRRHGPASESGGADHEYLQRERPADIIGFYGGLTSTIPRVYELARFYREKKIPVVAGGQHFAGRNITEALASGIDYVVVGEAEESITELLPAIIGRADLAGIKGIAYRANGSVVTTPARDQIEDFSRYPLPDFSLVRYSKLDLYPVERIRGCGMNCEFCTVKGQPRCAPPERLFEQISSLVETRDAKHFFVVDDLFGQQRSETIRFCEMLRDYQGRIGKRLDLTVQMRLDKAKDPELLAVMRQAGVNTTAVGFESPLEEELTAMNKRIRPEEMLSLTKILHKFGFWIHGMFIFGYPIENGGGINVSVKERIRRFRKFIRRARLDTIQVLLPVPLPGTELRLRLEKENRIYPLAKLGWEYYDGNFPLFKPDGNLSPEQSQYAIRKIMGKFYRFRNMFSVALHVVSFTGLIFFLHNLNLGWRKWYRHWRNSLFRFGGWLTLRGWLSAFKRDSFSEKLRQAKRAMQDGCPADPA